MTGKINFLDSCNTTKNEEKKEELGELINTLLKNLKCADVSEFFELLKVAYKENDRNFYKQLGSLVCNNEIDWLQKIYQYYAADRQELKQDFTPTSLAILTSKLAIKEDGHTILDCCCGSGALTIQAAQIFPKSSFQCIEIDNNVIPILKANLEMRGIRHNILQYNVIEDCNMAGPTEDSAFLCDYCVSNPPYNLKWKHPLFVSGLPRFSLCVPPESNANFVFVLTAMAHTSKVGAFILPKCVTSSDDESEVRKALVNANMVEAVVSCPGKMFESTDIPVCIIVINKQKITRKTCFVTIENFCKKYIREQAGQYGGNSHTKRIYEKSVNIVPTDLQDKIVNTIIEMRDEKGFSKCVDIETIKDNGYSLSPSLYVESDDAAKKEYRSYDDIVSDLNNITREKDRLKITINENAARCFGNRFFMALSQIEKSNECLHKIADGFKENGIEVNIQFADPVKISRCKNVIRIEQNSDDCGISHILVMLMNAWAEHYFFLNEIENKVLAELRDKTISDLMNPK